MKFDAEFLRDVLFNETGIVSDTIVGHGRWSVTHELIFSNDGKVFRTRYSVGATEYQDEQPFEYQNEIECQEVEPYEEMVTKYREIKS